MGYALTVAFSTSVGNVRQCCSNISAVLWHPEGGQWRRIFLWCESRLCHRPLYTVVFFFFSSSPKVLGFLLPLAVEMSPWGQTNDYLCIQISESVVEWRNSNKMLLTNSNIALLHTFILLWPGCVLRRIEQYPMKLLATFIQQSDQECWCVRVTR